MNVSLADVIVGHLVVFGHRQDPKRTFSDASKDIIAAKPKTWKLLMATVQEVAADLPDKTYEERAAEVKARLGW